MTQERMFLNEIIENPDDDAPRLVFADWLEERGDLRADFIRAQCELAKLPDHERRPDLEAREQQLLFRHGKQWAKPLRKRIKKWTFRRGLIDEVTVSAAAFLEHGEELLQRAPIQGVRLKDAGQLLGDLADCPWMQRITSLDFGGPNYWHNHPPAPPARIDDVMGLLCSPNLANLKHLKPVCLLHMRPWGSQQFFWSDLRGWKGLRNLHSLDLSETYQDWDWRRQVLPQITHLKELRTETFGAYNPSDPPAPLPGVALDRLTLDHAHLLDWELDFINANTEAAFVNCHAIDASPRIPSLLAHEAAKKVVGLYLENCRLTGVALKQLVECEGLSRLRALRLRNTSIPQSGLDALRRSRCLKDLAELDLTNCARAGDKDRGARAATGGGFPHLTTLRLGGNAISGRGLKRLVDSPVTKQLIRLELDRNPLGDEGGELLVRHGPWPRLCCLDLRATGLSDGVKGRLRRVFGSRVRY
ncbi:MAG: TIGR02996 domain-containing protein [Planctomycetales bacterium]